MNLELSICCRFVQAPISGLTANIRKDFYRGYGDTMRACSNGSTFTFESNGTCGSVTTPISAGGNGNSGPAGREYYYDLNGDGREEGALSGLTQVPGFDHHLT